MTRSEGARDEDIQPALVDARGMRCPWPVIRAARALREHRAIRILADDPMAPGELESLASEQGWIFSASAQGFEIKR